jgi:FtsP/CotA-like multicopper oxidase with cupredoxin domain
MIFILLIDLVISQVPVSPFGSASQICYQGSPFNVNGFPGSPFVIKPFTDVYKSPTTAVPKFKTCRSDNHCMMSYEFDVKDVQLRPFDNTIPSCKSFTGTWFITYSGTIPAPTIIQPSGHESLVRFNNKIKNKFTSPFSPCLPINKRTGRPFSVHFHGSASLAPFDGWAEDETCTNETKDYVYPNNRPTTGWYHDHALHITADNAYLGAAGMYIISAKKKDGGCGEPWNLDNIEERQMILADKVLDNKCQLLADILGVHQTNLYGDINVVSGVPFPIMPLEPKWYRFRFLNAAVSRPWLIKIKDSNSNDISQNICRVIATDGGYKKSSTPFPVNGLLIGVAERYEVVCDFTSLKGKTVYFRNDWDPVNMPGVPYFCNSHLIAKVIVGSSTAQPISQFNEALPAPVSVNHIEKIMSQDDLNTALKMANAGQSHRQFEFGRRNGHWTINGETWDTLKIAASDVGQNTWELWQFKSGGGWFHPVHIHLIDFFVLKREGARGVESYEFMSPKDVFYLGPSNTVYVVARFGAHKGDYMFHCHNLIHEDNDMLRAFRVMDTGMNSNQPSAQPYITNQLHKIIYNNWKYNDPMLGETAAKLTTSVKVHNQAFVTDTLNKNLYRIFYPLESDRPLGGFTNPWKSEWCKI